MAVKCGFTKLKYGPGQSRYKQNAIGYFKRGWGWSICPALCLPVSVEIKSPHRIMLHVSKHCVCKSKCEIDRSAFFGIGFIICEVSYKALSLPVAWPLNMTTKIV